jgi:hypothetical protein
VDDASMMYARRKLDITGVVLVAASEFVVPKDFEAGLLSSFGNVLKNCEPAAAGSYHRWSAFCSRAVSRSSKSSSSTPLLA